MTAKQSQVARLHAMGLTYEEIASRLGISRSSVYFRAAGAGLAPPERPRTKATAPRGPRAPAWEDEKPADAKDRVEREVAEGKRCAKCMLLLPCWDHAPAKRIG